MGSAAAAAGAGAVLGGIAGGQGQTATQQVKIGRQTALGSQIDSMFGRQLNSLEDLASVFGLSDMQAGREASLDLANQLQALSEGAFLPNTQDILTARGQSQNLLAGQRAGLQNIFRGQNMQANRNAASLGRSTNDPILQAQLRQQQAGMQSELLGQEQAMTQEIASSLPLQRLGFQQQRTSLLSGLGSQAMSNRISLLGAGTNIQNLQNQIRLGQTSTTLHSGGGMQGALTGALGGAGAGLTAGAGIQALGTQGGYRSLLGG